MPHALPATAGVVLLAAALVGCNDLIPEPPPTPSGGLCTNTCLYANDGDCDDGGPGSDYDLCSYGSDCGDCGARSGSNPGPTPGPGPNPGPSTATMMVYTNHRDTGGHIDVSVGGRSERLTRYYTGSGTLDCPTYTSGLTFVVELQPGSHAVSAVSQNGLRWSFDRNVQAGRCYGERLVYSGAAGPAVESVASDAVPPSKQIPVGAAPTWSR